MVSVAVVPATTPVAQKVRLTLTALYTDGQSLYDQVEFVADARILANDILRNRGERVVELRFVVPQKDAESIVEGIRRGEAELNVEGLHYFNE